MARFFAICSVMLLFGLPLGVPTALAELSWIALTTDRGEQVQALLGRPNNQPGPVPAVIYNHGTEVRQDGYKEAGGTTDVKGFVQALVAEGYVALAPIREFERRSAFVREGRLQGTPGQWEEVIEGGIRTTAAAYRYLVGQPFVDGRAIGAIGFSEGGNILLWALMEPIGIKAAVLLAPAAISVSTKYRLGAASLKGNVARITAPVFLAVMDDDNRAIREATTRFLIPNLSEANKNFEHRTDYPGGHFSFWKVREDYWRDATGFLRRHLR